MNHFPALRHQIQHNLSWKVTRKQFPCFSEISSCADGGLSLGEKNCQFRRIYYPPEISIDGRKGGSPNISFFMNLIIFATWAALNRTLGPTFSLWQLFHQSLNFETYSFQYRMKTDHYASFPQHSATHHQVWHNLSWMSPLQDKVVRKFEIRLLPCVSSADTCWWKSMFYKLVKLLRLLNSSHISELGRNAWHFYPCDSIIYYSSRVSNCIKQLKQSGWLRNQNSRIPSEVRIFSWECLNNSLIEAYWGSLIVVASLFSNNLGSLIVAALLRQHK